MKTKDLYFFTAGYPYGKSETFIENEIEILCKHFNRVFIFPNLFNNDFCRPIPDNAELIEIPSAVFELPFFDRIKFNSGLAIFSLIELIRNPVSSNTFRYRIANFNQLYSRYWRIKKMLKIKHTDNIVFYSYWFEEWAVVLSELKRKVKIDSFISRAHGFDIYEERRKDGFIPFRQFQLEMVDKVYCASKASMAYLKSKYPKFADKISYSHLGVHDHGINPYLKTDKFTFVSCSNVIPLKQVLLIPEILKSLGLNIRWIHFGDGEEFNKLKDKIEFLPDNIEVELKGRVSNDEVLQFYRNNSVDLFLHFSSSEGGVPVSIQEAISFGIPVIAINVGGVPEIVNENSGILIDYGLDAKDISIEIKKNLDRLSNLDFRNNLKKNWKKNFTAKSNYKSFIKSIIE